jgi:hypothetical protein
MTTLVRVHITEAPEWVVPTPEMSHQCGAAVMHDVSGSSSPTVQHPEVWKANDSHASSNSSVLDVADKVSPHAMLAHLEDIVARIIERRSLDVPEQLWGLARRAANRGPGTTESLDRWAQRLADDVSNAGD